MQWKFESFGAKPSQAGREEKTPTGTFHFAPKPPLPKRDSYFAIAEIQDSQALTTCLTEYWLKVAEVLPRYYAGRSSLDPLADQAPETIAPDNGWDRIVCLLDAGNEKVTTNLWKGSQRPIHSDRVWVIARFPTMIERIAKHNDWHSIMISALADAAGREPARTALLELQRWRPLELWVMAAHDEDTLRPLQQSGRISAADRRPL